MGNVQGRLFARVLGSNEGEPGLVLFYDETSVSRIVTLVDRGHIDEAMNTDLLGVTFESSPAFAIHTLERIYGLPKLPTPLKIKSGQSLPIEEADLLLLSAALRCVSVLDETQGSEAQVKIEGCEVWTVAFPFAQ